jgi:hypothetical protein
VCTCAGGISVAFMIRLAILLALTTPDRPVIGERPTAAQPTTEPQPRIQHIEDVYAHLELAQSHLAKDRPDDPLDLALVTGPSC